MNNKFHAKERCNKKCYVLRLISLWLLTLCIPELYAQKGTAVLLSVRMENGTIEDVLKQIEANSDYVFLYSDSIRPLLKKDITIKAERQSLPEILDKTLAHTLLGYDIEANQVTLFLKDKKTILLTSKSHSL